MLLLFGFFHGEASASRIAGALPAPASPPGAVSAVGQPSPAAVVSGPAGAWSAGRAWTGQEMLDARPVPPGGIGAGATGRHSPDGASVSADGTSPLPSPGGPVNAEPVTDAGSARYRANGKLFFEMGGEPWECSATAVEARRRNVIITAGHCVFDQLTEDGEGEWARNMVFVPAYAGGKTPDGVYAVGPFGQYPAASAGMVAPRGWVSARLQNYDLAAVALDRPLEPDVGARKIDFRADLTRRELELLGYPGTPAPFDGEKLIRCVPASVGFDWSRDDPRPFEAGPCRLWQGASGGGWIAGGRYLVSVISYGYCSETSCAPGLYGPAFGDAAINLYNNEAIGGSARPSLRLVKRPPRKTLRRAFNVRVDGAGATPVVFKVRLDREKPVFTKRVIRVRKLSTGRHTLRIRSADQTGRLSRRTVVRKFRVLPKKTKKTHRIRRR